MSLCHYSVPVFQASEARLRSENDSLRNEAKEKKALIDKLVDTDFVAKAGQKAVRFDWSRASAFFLYFGGNLEGNF